MTRIFLIAFLGCLGLAGFAWGQTPVHFGPGSNAPILSVDRSDMDGTELSLSVRTLDSAIVETKGGPFNTLSLGDYGFTSRLGGPSLPVICEFIEIPHGARCVLELSEEVYVERTLAELGIGNRIVPTQAPVPDQAGAAEAAPFVMDHAVYASDEFVLAETALLAEKVILRGRSLVVLKIQPVNYKPQSGVVRVLTSAKISMTFLDGDAARTREALARYSTATFDGVVYDTVLNGRSFEAGAMGLRKGSSRATGYLMIADPAFTGNASLLSLIGRREAEGFDVTLVDTNTTGTSNTSIKNYIQTAYDTWNPAPEYILLIGDTNTIPHWTGQGSDNPATDLDYACLDGSDYIPDVMRGRFPVRTTTHLTRLCDKIIAMMSSGTNEKVACLAGNDYWSWWESAHNTVISNHFDPNGWTSDKLYCHTYNATTTQVKNAFNDGRTFGCYRGHGSTTSWADGPPFSKSNVQSLTNTVYPSIWSFSCLTGKYSITECFGEAWVRDDHGATSFLGASVVSYTTENNSLYKKCFNGLFDYGHVRVGAMVDYGQYELYLNMSGGNSFKRSYYEMYNLMGDPAMEVITGGSGADPVPDIKVNGDDGPLTIPHTTNLNITISLDPGDHTGEAHDWWIFVERDWSKTYWWTPPNNWTLSATPIRAHDGGLVNFSNYSVANGKAPVGWYEFSFDVDALNGNHEATFSDTVTVQVY